MFSLARGPLEALSLDNSDVRVVLEHGGAGLYADVHEAADELGAAAAAALRRQGERGRQCRRRRGRGDLLRVVFLDDVVNVLRVVYAVQDACVQLPRQGNPVWALERRQVRR